MDGWHHLINDRNGKLQRGKEVQGGLLACARAHGRAKMV